MHLLVRRWCISHTVKQRYSFSFASNLYIITFIHVDWSEWRLIQSASRASHSMQIEFTATIVCGHFHRTLALHANAKEVDDQRRYEMAKLEMRNFAFAKNRYSILHKDMTNDMEFELESRRKDILWVCSLESMMFENVFIPLRASLASVVASLCTNTDHFYFLIVHFIDDLTIYRVGQSMCYQLKVLNICEIIENIPDFEKKHVVWATLAPKQSFAASETLSKILFFHGQIRTVYL